MPVSEVTTYECDSCGNTSTELVEGWQILDAVSYTVTLVEDNLQDVADSQSFILCPDCDFDVRIGARGQNGVLINANAAVVKGNSQLPRNFYRTLGERRSLPVERYNEIRQELADNG